MRLGFIGTGTITSAIVTGLCRANPPSSPILVSPRNAEKASALAATYSQVRVAKNNQSLVDGSDCIFLAVGTQVAREVLGSLRFRADQHIISLIGMLSLAKVQKLVAPATIVFRAVPLPPVARATCPIAFFPPDTQVAGLLDRIGTAVALDDEDQFNALCAVTALMAPFYALLTQTQTWLTAQGVEADVASRYVLGMFNGLCLDAIDVGAEGFESITAKAQTPGGLNEEALRRLTDADWYNRVDSVLDIILARIEGRSADGAQNSPQA